jgi:hypothetical protein
LCGLNIYKAQPTLDPLPGDYGLVKMPGAPAHIEAMLLGWRFSHAAVYVGHGQLVEAWFDCVRERPRRTDLPPTAAALSERDGVS